MTLPKVTIKGGPSPATTFIELDGAKMQCVVSGRYILSPDPDGLNVLQLDLAAEIEEITHEGPIIISLGDGKRYLLRDIEELPGTVEGEELGKHVVRYFKRVSEAGEIA